MRNIVPSRSILDYSNPFVELKLKSDEVEEQVQRTSYKAHTINPQWHFPERFSFYFNEINSTKLLFSMYYIFSIFNPNYRYSFDALSAPMNLGYAMIKLSDVCHTANFSTVPLINVDDGTFTAGEVNIYLIFLVYC